MADHDRFMPRTAQLQERKRRREDDCKRETLAEACTSSKEVMIGPQLPGIPKVDTHDGSWNTTASLIREKLKEVRSLNKETFKRQFGYKD